MQGINRGKHGHLVDALIQLEVLLNKECVDYQCLQQSADHRKELETLYRKYELLLDELAGQISAYEALYDHVKIQFLGKKLKALKKQITGDTPAFTLLQVNIQRAYGT